jgi:hypothetical protein
MNLNLSSGYRINLGGPPRPEEPPEILKEPVSLAPAWKAAAQKYRALAAEMDEALTGSEHVVAGLAAERDAARARVAALEAAVRQLRADLWEFGDHQRNCARLKTSTAEAGCTCGYHKALGRNAEVKL